ncbi:angiopoietin-related protein 7-like isoform X2 [Dreissena polymorpha]|uniref:angiopoietin-related protein 7-like isoform X2 n=1 Tax=Dreissena polymorpha TaxID=45954 RepID=UPI0022656C35|nr:angiopoietin-related protein 7-like isoform X2 [Dreissena polymorpha]
MFLGFGVSLILGSLCYVDCLTCLQCLNIESPRHCRHVKECSPSEVCYVNQKVDEYGDVLFDIGCKNASRCSNSSHGSHACDYCCNGSLCNAAGCGQPGYPSNRGPICYSCSTHTNQGSCQKIDFCDSNEVCMVQEELEFGERVHTSKCVVLEQCEHYTLNILPIVGRSLSDQQRSATETICRQCCHGDLCNSNCTTTTTTPTTTSSTTTATTTTSSTTTATTTTTTNSKMKDCKEIGLGTHINGVYTVRPEGTYDDIEVYCDMATDGGGWTVFQRRVNGSLPFDHNFASYVHGFGNIHAEFWLGLQYIHAMTYNAKSELRIDLIAADGSTAYEVFPNFRLSSAPNFTLHIDTGHGTAGKTDL